MPTYYVDGAVGNDAADGLSEGAPTGSPLAGAWATIDHAMNNVVAGDLVYVKASVTYDENAEIDTYGTAASPIIFEGYSTTPGDGGRPVWRNTSGDALTDTAFGSNSYYVFRHFDFDGSSGDGVSVGGNFAFYDCIFQNNGGDGCEAGGTFLNCEFINNTTYGLDLRFGNCKVFGCLSHGNGWNQIDLNATTVLYKVLVYGNTGFSLINNSGFDDQMFLQVTSDGQGTSNDCMDLASRRVWAIIDCILYDKANGVLNTDVAQNQHWNSPLAYNLLSSNTTDYNNCSGFTAFPVGLNDASPVSPDNPRFEDEANSDYRLASDSPAKNAGLQIGRIT